MDICKLKGRMVFVMTREKVFVALKQVIDPELGVNIVDLGLVYEVDLKKEGERVVSVNVEMSLTTPGCPLGGYFLEQVNGVVARATGLDEEMVKVQIVWDPPWIPDMMKDEIRAELGLD